MNAFGRTSYKIINAYDPPTLIFLLGGFVLSMICAALALTPWFRRMPHRILLAAGGVFPTVVLIYAEVFDLFMRGRGLAIMITLGPILLSFVPTGLSFCGTIEVNARNKKIIFYTLLTLLLIGQMWASFICWLATDTGFMGASC